MMKRSFALLTALLVSQLAGAEARDPVIERTKTIIIPSVEFKDTPFGEALASLEAASYTLDTHSPKSERGVKIVLRHPDAETVDLPITLRLSNVPLAEAIRYTAALAECVFLVAGGKVFVVPETVKDGAPDDLWYAAFLHLQSSDGLANSGQSSEARRRLVQAQGYYKILRDKHPGFRPRVVDELLRQVETKLATSEVRE